MAGRPRTRVGALPAGDWRLPAEARSILDAVVVFDRVPRWMAPLPPRASDVREAGLLVAALDALAQALGYERVRVA